MRVVGVDDFLCMHRVDDRLNLGVVAAFAGAEYRAVVLFAADNLAVFLYPCGRTYLNVLVRPDDFDLIGWVKLFF